MNSNAHSTRPAHADNNQFVMGSKRYPMKQPPFYQKWHLLRWASSSYRWHVTDVHEGSIESIPAGKKGLWVRAHDDDQIQEQNYLHSLVPDPRPAWISKGDKTILALMNHPYEPSDDSFSVAPVHEWLVPEIKTPAPDLRVVKAEKTAPEINQSKAEVIGKGVQRIDGEIVIMLKSHE